MTVRNYTSAAPSTTLAGAITNVATSLTVASSSGYPSTPFVAIINRDLADEEAVYVTNVFGTNWTVTRGYDGTTALSHLSGAKVEHGVTAIEFREANAHNNATSDVHGVTGGLKTYIDAGDTTNSSALTTHAALTSGVHGVTGSIQSRLTATEGVANAATTSANTANTTANTATTNLATHIANGTGVHGVAGNLATVISSGDQARYCSVRWNTTASISHGGSWQNIGMNNEWADVQGWHTGTGSGIAPNEAGIYLITAGLTWAGTAVTTGYRGAQIIVNNGSDLALATDIAGGDTTSFTGPAHTLSAICWANGSGDYFALRASQWHASSASLNIASDTAWITVVRLGAQ